MGKFDIKLFNEILDKSLTEKLEELDKLSLL